MTRDQRIHYAAVHTWLDGHAEKAGKCQMPLVNDVSLKACTEGEGGTDWARRPEFPWTWDGADFDASKFVEVCRPCHTKLDLPLACPKGHEFTEENTYITRDGSRQCRACNRETQLAYKKRHGLPLWKPGSRGRVPNYATAEQIAEHEAIIAARREETTRK